MLRTCDVITPETESMLFSDLLLSEPILRGLSAGGFTHPSPIQLKAIPLGRFGCDIIAQAKSGTGKTLVFIIIALEAIMEASSNREPHALVIAPTREIAIQIRDVAISVGRFIPNLSVHAFIGGLPISADRKRLSTGCHLAVATPGRLCELIEKSLLPLSSLRTLILDEADKLNEKGFRDTIKWIISKLPRRKQVIAVSATFPLDLINLCCKYMRTPQIIRLCGTKGQKLAAVATSTTDLLVEDQFSLSSEVLHIKKNSNTVNPSNIENNQNIENIENVIAEALKKGEVAENVATGSLVGSDLRLLGITLYYCICPSKSRDNITHESMESLIIDDNDMNRISDIYTNFQTNSGRTFHDDLFDAKVCKIIQILKAVRFSQCIIFCNDKSRAQPLQDALEARNWSTVSISGTKRQNERIQAITAIRTGISRILISTDLTARGVDINTLNLVVNMDLPSDDSTFMHRVGRVGRFGTRGVAISLLSPHENRLTIEKLPHSIPESLYLLSSDVSNFIIHQENREIPKSSSSDEYEKNREIPKSSSSDEYDCEDFAQNKKVDAHTENKVEKNRTFLCGSQVLNVQDVENSQVLNVQGVENSKVLNVQGVENSKVLNVQGVENSKVLNVQGVENISNYFAPKVSDTHQIRNNSLLSLNNEEASEEFQYLHWLGTFTSAAKINLV